jgi:hypothetical protein
MDKWDYPYQGDNLHRTTKHKEAWGKSGIYLIRENSGSNIIRYIGMSRSNLYKALYRHFESWEDNRQRRVVYSDRSAYEVRVIVCELRWVDYIEQRLIQYFNPPDNDDKYEGQTPQMPVTEQVFEVEPEDECPF